MSNKEDSLSNLPTSSPSHQILPITQWLSKSSQS